MYHRTQRGVAAAPKYPGVIREQVREAALIAMRSLPLNAHDSQLMRDVRREDGPYQFRALDRLFDLLAQVPDECEALAFIENLRGALIARRERNEAHDLREDAMVARASEGMADVAVLEVLCAPSPDLMLVQGALDALGREKHSVERLMDDLFGVRFALGAK